MVLFSLFSGNCKMICLFSFVYLRKFHPSALTLSQPGATLCPPYQNHRISSKRFGVWSCCFTTFLSDKFPFRKFQFHQSALLYVAMATIQLFSIILKTRISIVFQVFPSEKKFYGRTFYVFDIIII